MSLRSVICGALEVGEIWTTWSGIDTDCAIGIVALDAISPMITFAPFDLISFVAASTDAVAWEKVAEGRYMPRRFKGSCKGRALG